MSDDTKWSGMKLEELRIVAKKYKAFHSLGNISKANKGALIETLKKFMSWEGESLKQKTNATPITVEKVAPKAKKAPAPKEPPKAPPAPALATGDKSYKKKVVARKVVQAREASVNAEAIAEQAKAMGKSIAERKKIMDEREKQVQKKGKAQARRAVGDAMAIKPPKMEEMKPEAPPRPAVATGDKSYKKKVVAKKVVQARGASADAMAIKPPKMEERTEEERKLDELLNEEKKINEERKKLELEFGEYDKTKFNEREKYAITKRLKEIAPDSSTVKMLQVKIITQKRRVEEEENAPNKEEFRAKQKETAIKRQKEDELDDKYREIEEEREDLEAERDKEWSKMKFMGEPLSVAMKKIMKRLEEIDAEKKLLKKGIMPSKATPKASSAPPKAPPAPVKDDLKSAIEQWLKDKGEKYSEGMEGMFKSKMTAGKLDKDFTEFIKRNKKEYPMVKKMLASYGILNEELTAQEEQIIKDFINAGLDNKSTGGQTAEEAKAFKKREMKYEQLVSKSDRTFEYWINQVKYERREKKKAKKYA